MSIVRRAVSPATAPASAAIVTGLLGALISLTGSWIPSLWGDEAASELSASRSLPSLLAMLQHVDAVHGTYYLGLHLWVAAFGDTPFSLRLPSALAIGACVAAMVLIGTRIDSLRLGIVAGAICAVLPRVTYMGEEARSYAFSAAIAAWLTYLLVRIIQRSGRSRCLWILYGVLTAAGIYVFLYLALIAIGHLVLLLMTRRRREFVIGWVVASGSALVAAAPLIVTGILERGQIAYLATRNDISFDTIAVTMWFGNATFAILAWLLVAGAIALYLRDWRRTGFPVRTSTPVCRAPSSDWCGCSCPASC